MLIGITGGIASGKSTISGYLEQMGCAIISADRINRELSKPGGNIWAKVKERFGDQALGSDRKIDGKKLGCLIFSDPRKKKLLEEISHPLIVSEENRRIKKIREQTPDRVIALEAALIIEAGSYRRLDKLILVAVDTERQMARLMTNKGLSREEAEMRIKAQTPWTEKTGYADYIVHNNGTKEELRQRVENLFLEIEQGQALV